MGVVVMMTTARSGVAMHALRTQITRWAAMARRWHGIIEARTRMIANGRGSLISFREQGKLLVGRAKRLQTMQQIRFGQISQMQSARDRSAERLQVREALIRIR